MFQFKNLFLVICGWCFLTGFALECGINVNGSEDHFKELTNLCSVGNNRSVTATQRPHTISSSSSEEDDDDDRNENSKSDEIFINL